MGFKDHSLTPPDPASSRDFSISWDSYFHNICKAVASKSPCHSRKIGAILVFDHSVVATGFNGPPRGTPHCEPANSWMVSEVARHIDFAKLKAGEVVNVTRIEDIQPFTPSPCPRYHRDTYQCLAVHAEVNTIIDAARKGTITVGTTLYMNSCIPCHRCMAALVNAGVHRIVIESLDPYDTHSEEILNSSDIDMRAFNNTPVKGGETSDYQI